MNHKKIYTRAVLTFTTLAFTAISCNEDWLQPKPLSFYEPGIALSNVQGLYSALTTCERNMRHEYFGDGAPILTEIIQSEIAVEGTTDKDGPTVNSDVEQLHDADLNKKETETEEGRESIVKNE